MKYTPDDKIAFWSNVRPGPHCWAWTGPMVRGIPVFRDRDAAETAWELGNPGSTVREGSKIVSTCRTPGCVRPDHLERRLPPGAKQMGRKPRVGNDQKSTPPKEQYKHGRSKLSAADVETMRVLREGGWTLTAISKRFKVAHTTVWHHLRKLEKRAPKSSHLKPVDSDPEQAKAKAAAE